MLRQANGGSAPADEAATSVQVGTTSVKGADIVKNILWLVSLSFLVVQVLETLH